MHDVNILTPHEPNTLIGSSSLSTFSNYVILNDIETRFINSAGTNVSHLSQCW